MQPQIILASRELQSGDLGDFTSFRRTDGKYVEYTFDMQFNDPMLLLGLYTEQDLLRGDPSLGLDIGLLQVVELRDLLRKPAVQAALQGTNCFTGREVAQLVRDSKPYSRPPGVNLELVLTPDGILFEISVPPGQALDLSPANSVVLSYAEMIMLAELLERDSVCEVLDHWQEYIEG